MNEITNRTLGTVLLKLRSKRDEHMGLDTKWQAAARDSSEQDEIGDKMAALDTEIMDLEQEARVLIGELTGVPFELIQEANL